MPFEEAYSRFWQEFGEGRIMVLSTSLNDAVTSRSVSVAALHGKFWFQTDRTFRKYGQLTQNPNVALCVDNIQVEGRCTDLGSPAANSEFCSAYQRCFSGSYHRYSHLENERLFEVAPIFIERWHYLDGAPFIETFDVLQKRYALQAYHGR